MIYAYSKELYPKLVLIKAAYNYTDKYYVHMDIVEDKYEIELTPKSNELAIDENEFDNEILIQLARYEILKSTQDIRKLVLARSMASTIIDDPVVIEADDEKDMSNILKDWFENE